MQRQAEKARLRQAVRDYEEKGRSEFAFPLEQLKQMYKQFVEPHLVDEKIRMFFEQKIADLDQITRSFSLLSKLPKGCEEQDPPSQSSGCWCLHSPSRVGQV